MLTSFLPMPLRSIARRLKLGILNILIPGRKEGAELQFWKDEIKRYEQWYAGNLPIMYDVASPNDSEKVDGKNLSESAILTWHKLHQEPKYLADLELDPLSFSGKKLLDIGSGPIPSATCFLESELYCLDPLLTRYQEAGFPRDCYGNVHFVDGPSEQMPFEDGQFDAVIAVNSIDHVDNIKKTAKEISRVLKSGGLIRMHVHYHRATITEPLELNDEKMIKLFSWCSNFRKIAERNSIRLGPGERFALWGNF